MAEAVDRAAAVELGSLRYGDLPAVLEIERASFQAPWSLGMFATELAKPSTIRIAARSGGQLVGYLICSRYADAWHLMNVAVVPTWRRCGVGTRLVRELIGRLEAPARVTLEVRESNRGAIRMYESLGFRAAGRRPGYYPDNGESAVLMWLNPPRGEW
jgi:ribosomal-protein-alanine N-acetyltransferase